MAPIIKNSFLIINSVPFIILCVYLVDYLFSALSILIEWNLLFFTVYLMFKSYVYAGIYGVLVELVSGEEILPTLRAFHKNARKFWLIYLGLSYLVFLTGTVLSAVLSTDTFSPYHLFIYLDMFIMLIMASWIIKTKYAPGQKTPAGPSSIIGLGGLYLIQLVVHFLLIEASRQNNEFLQILMNLAVKYIDLFIFLYIANLFIERSGQIKDTFNARPEIYVIDPIAAGVSIGLVSKLLTFNPPFFVVLKALSPSEYKFREFNKAIWNKRYYQKNKLVAITCFTSNSAEAYKIARGFKENGSTVVMGGPHVTYFPEEALEYCDSVVVGEAEGVWAGVVEDYEKGALKKKYHGSTNEEAHQKVHQQLLRSPPYVIKDFIETARGCKFKCHFCTIPSLTGGRLRTKPTFEIVELIEKIRHRYQYINLLDNNIYNDPVYARELFKALKPLKMKWQTNCTMDIAKNDELLKLAREAGCYMLIFGYEISEASEEAKKGGKFAMAQKYLEFTKKIKAARIHIRANFIFGFESDSWRNLLNLWRFAFKVNGLQSDVNFLTPVPGSRTFEEMVARQKIVNLNWHNYNGFNQVFKHNHLDPIVMSRFFSPLINSIFSLTTSKYGYVILLFLSIFIILLINKRP